MPSCISPTTYGALSGPVCTIGHAAIVHACTIGDECLTGHGGDG